MFVQYSGGFSVQRRLSSTVKVQKSGVRRLVSETVKQAKYFRKAVKPPLLNSAKNVIAPVGDLHISHMDSMSQTKASSSFLQPPPKKTKKTDSGASNSSVKVKFDENIPNFFLYAI